MQRLQHYFRAHRRRGGAPEQQARPVEPDRVPGGRMFGEVRQFVELLQPASVMVSLPLVHLAHLSSRDVAHEGCSALTAECLQAPAADLHAGWDANAHMVPMGEIGTRDTMLSFDGDAWLNSELEHRDLVFELSDYHQQYVDSRGPLRPLRTLLLLRACQQASFAWNDIRVSMRGVSALY